LVTFIGDNRRARRSKTTAGIPPSSPRATSQNPQQRWYTSHGHGELDCFSDCVAARIIRDRSSGVLGRIALSGSRLHLKLHLIHHCAAENGCERRVRSISALSNAHEARLWSKASRVEQDPASPKKSFDIGVKVRWMKAVGICAHESSWDSQ